MKNDRGNSSEVATISNSVMHRDNGASITSKGGHKIWLLNQRWKPSNGVYLRNKYNGAFNLDGQELS